MRIAVLSWTRRRMAGQEAYLAAVIGALRGAGHAIALAHEVDEPRERELVVRDDCPQWCIETSGPDRVVAQLKAWAPDVLFSQGLLDSVVESRLIELAPAVLFPLGYYGTCISGAK